MKFILKSMIIVSLVMLGTSHLHAELVLNGSFEDPDVPDGSFSVFGPGSTAITNWTVIGSSVPASDVAIVDQDAMLGALTFQAQSGRQWLDLAGNSTNNMSSGVMQTVATTAGTEYLLSFWVGSATNNNFNIFPSTVRLEIDGGAPISFTNPAAPTTMLDWKQFTQQFTAQSASTTITFLNGSSSINELSGLDNVTLTAVPEPSSLAMVVICSIAAVLNRRRHCRRTMR